ncbi:glycosyltransferase, partial [Desulfobacterales bacterium HSG17]|nr:glycosyltransferase [Desulfobacterales bacterium HSG17]
KKYNPENYDPGKFTILVTGGSQGAASINNAFMDALELMNPANHISDQFNIIHQTGVNDEADVKKRYKNLKINATARAFFHDMPKLQDVAELVITRAGAGIISELTIKGLPAILIPFPHAADDHQTFNAKALEEQGAAVMIQDKNLTGDTLKAGMENLIFDKEKLKSMSTTLKSLAMPDADVKIASYILKTVTINKG